MAQTQGSSRSPPRVDDKDSVQRFLDAMVRKNLNAFTNSKPSLPVKVKVTSQQNNFATDSSAVDPFWREVSNKTTSELTLKNVKEDVMTEMEDVIMQTDVAECQIPTPSSETENGRLSKAVSPFSPAEFDTLQNPNITPRVTVIHNQRAALPSHAPSHTNKLLTSPLVSGLRAPPPTPDAVPTTNIKQVIVDAFGDLQVGSPPNLVLGASRHAPPHPKSKENSKENIRPSEIKDDMPRFFSPSKILSPEEKQQRDESFQRVLALTSPHLVDVKENKRPAAFGKADMGKGILGSRWAENGGELFERRKPGTAAISIVDPKSNVRTSPPTAEASSFFETPTPPVSAVAESPHTSKPTPAAKASILAMPADVALPVTAEAAGPTSGNFQSWLLTKEKPPTPRITATNPTASVSAETSSATSGFKTFEASAEPNETNLYFSSWPKLTERDAPRTLPPISSSLRKRLADLQILAARIRRVSLVNLPPDSSAKFVQSLVFGGPLELVNVGSSSASVVFLHAEDCIKYYDATSNGLVYKKDGGKEDVCFVELAKDVDIMGGLLRGYIEYGVTRCVRAIGVEEEWGLPALFKMAGRKGRKVEHVIDGVSAGGTRSVIFRFCNVQDAVRFKAMLARDEEWEHCNIHYAPDP
ncbi:MAG: hypothetical protein M1830_001151, partial [Pleopsidium flavum]